MPSVTAEVVIWEAERAELEAVLQSPLFVRSPALTHLLSYLCEKTFAGETDQIKEYSIAVDVFDRQESFDQDTDSIVRVHANRLRKRLSEYYAAESNVHELQIGIPVGQYVPTFQRVGNGNGSTQPTAPSAPAKPESPPEVGPYWQARAFWFTTTAVFLLSAAVIGAFIASRKPTIVKSDFPAAMQQPSEPQVGLPVGDEIHLLAGSVHKYVDHTGKLWSPDTFFSGGAQVASSVQHIWRTQDPIIYRNSRQGDFAYGIPLKPGSYELRLHFAETFYGPENAGGGGEGSRTMTITLNGEPLLHDFDVLADAGEERTAEVKVFHDVSPGSDGQLHLSFFSGKSGSAMLSGIEVLPGVRGHIRPVRIVARDVPYYSNDSRWWSPDIYFKGGQLSSSQESADGTDDPEFYETARWGHFSYAIPVAPGGYIVTLHFIEHNGDAAGRNGGPSSEDRVFNVFCNGRTILSNLNIFKQAGKNHPLVRVVRGLEPNAQGKLLLEFVPVTGYATVSAIEVVAE